MSTDEELIQHLPVFQLKLKRQTLKKSGSCNHNLCGSSKVPAPLTDLFYMNKLLPLIDCSWRQTAHNEKGSDEILSFIALFFSHWWTPLSI